MEAFEGDLLLEIKKVNGVLAKVPKVGVGEKLIEVGGLKYNREIGAVSGKNTGEYFILMSVGDEFPAGLVVSQRKRNRLLAEEAKKRVGTLPLAVPGIHDEAAQDLMCTASTKVKDPFGRVVRLLLDSPSYQRSKQYYLKKMEEFFENCQEAFGMVENNFEYSVNTRLYFTMCSCCVLFG